jgi:PKD repeat protein
MLKKILNSLILSILIILISFNFNVNSEQINTNFLENPDIIVLNYTFDTPSFRTIKMLNEEFTRLSIKNLPMYGNVGEPRLPVKPIKILLPKSTTIKNINVEASNVKTIKIENLEKIELGSKSFKNDEQISTQLPVPNYDTSKLYPSTLFSSLGIQYFRGFAYLNINIFPIQYLEETNTFYYYEEISISIETKKSITNQLFRGINKDKQVFENIENLEAINSYEKDIFSSPQLSATYDYIIITPEELKNTIGIYTFDDLIEQRENQGLTCRYKTIEQIENEYEGVDTQEKIRNFIKYAYSNWGTTWILLGGDVHHIPIRYLYDIDGEDEVLASDLYYQCLDGDYNYDGDEYWGERYDGENGERIDLYAEVYVGRAPVDDGNDISNFVEKTLAYENSEWNSDDYIRNVLSVGEKVWNGPGGYGAGYVERCIGHNTDYDQDTHGIPADDFSIIELYERDINWTQSDLIEKINEGVSIINHVGHGSSLTAMKLNIFTVESLENEGKYNLFYTQACHSGQLEAQDECFAERWVNTQKAGGFAAIMNTGYGYGGVSDYDGPDNRYAREFFDALFSPYEGISRIGIANQDSKEDNIWHIDEAGKEMYHVYYSTMLFGDPYVEIKGAENTNVDFSWSPEYPETFEEISFIDQSTGYISSKQWDFGDGNISYEDNPIHYYSTEGIYSVTLTIINGAGFISTITKDLEINNDWDPIAIASYENSTENEFTVQFYGNDSFDPDGIIVSYEWDFDDDTTSDLINPIHEFTGEGQYYVRLMVTDNENNKDAVYLNMNLLNQTPPEKPDIPQGSTEGIIGNEYYYSVITNDFEEDIIKYGINWDDGSPIEWSNQYYNSGEICTMSHIWLNTGNYNINVIAKDIHGAESEWSDTLHVLINENDAPIVEIVKPIKSIYVFNKTILPFFMTIIIGNIDIEITASDLGFIERIEFYIDNSLESTVTCEPYIFTWKDRSLINFKHIIKVIVYDNLGEFSIDEITVLRFL